MKGCGEGVCVPWMGADMGVGSADGVHMIHMNGANRIHAENADGAIEIQQHHIILRKIYFYYK